MNNDVTYYLVWWGGEENPEDCLMGIHFTRESAESLVSKINDYRLKGDAYITEEKRNAVGELY